MSKVDYILRHPYRIFTEQNCEVLIRENDNWNFKKEHKVVIPVDNFKDNQDPYVFHTPWIHAYCHINQLRSDTGHQSILIWGSWNKTETKFLVDTVYVVDKRYQWKGNEPSLDFRREYPYTIHDGIYKEVLKHKPNKTNTDRMYTANHYDFTMEIVPHVRYIEHYSFLPLKLNNGVFELIDILPIMDEYDKEFTKNMRSTNQAGITKDLYFSNKIVRYLIENANTLVTKVLNTKSPNVVDRELQNKYYPIIYDTEYVEQSSKCKCSDITNK